MCSLYYIIDVCECSNPCQFPSGRLDLGRKSTSRRIINSGPYQSAADWRDKCSNCLSLSPSLSLSTHKKSVTSSVFVYQKCRPVAPACPRRFPFMQISSRARAPGKRHSLFHSLSGSLKYLLYCAWRFNSRLGIFFGRFLFLPLLRPSASAHSALRETNSKLRWDLCTRRNDAFLDTTNNNGRRSLHSHACVLCRAKC